MAAAILILGEHDKGHGEPFSLKTVSGRRLRTMTADLCLDADLGNVFEFTDGHVVERDLKAICRPYSIVAVVGRVAQAECERQGIKHVALPHPAVRSTKQLTQLRNGLAELESTV